MNVIQFDTFTSFDYALGFCDRDDAIAASPVYNWLMYGKLPEDITIYPSYGLQYSTANGQNRYIRSVTVMPIPTSNITVNLAAGATSTFTFANAKGATTSDPAIATVNFVNGVLTVTGVAAGTATITVSNGTAANTVANITVVVA